MASCTGRATVVPMRRGIPTGYARPAPTRFRVPLACAGGGVGLKAPVP